MYQQLREDFDWLRSKWSEFHELYEKGQERIDLLNSTASNFFYFLRRLFFEDAILHVCRLTDRSTIRGHDTLTLRSLAGKISDQILKASVEAKVNQIEQDCKFARDWRDQRLAHMDLATIQQPRSVVLDPVVPSQIDRALESFSDLLRLVEDHVNLPPVIIVRDPWGAKALVYRLKRAESAIEAEREGYQELAAGRQ